ncbi:MAG TPA: macrolide ABC transporter ATP-binding protein [Armatimonadetes bacterium]|jgi:ABC-type lipoprotein export system ATPase subunit|nr:macrolide ABC transporter ATP-binding protein [Armatimonadota bacterium]
MNDGEYVIQARDLVKTYTVGKRRVEALRGIDVSLAPGEFAVLLGPSGAGKTTTLNLVGCLDLPTSGDLTVAGHPISGNGARPTEAALDLLRRQHIGFIFADFNLLLTLTAMENVQVPLIWRDATAPGRARQLLERVGLAHRLTHRPDELSGGEMQRVAVARALINQPDLLLADEPTANLDTRTRDEILELLAELSTEGVAVLLATHDHELADRADTVLRIEDGVIADD